MLLDAKDSLLLVIDPQASLMPLVMESERVTAVVNKLISIARELDVPALITEHYPEGLKPTIPEIAKHLGEDYKPLLKTVFSCFGADGFREAVEKTGRSSLIAVGIETHICVLQTVQQGLDAGYRVYVAADGVSCRKEFDHRTALDRMQRAGAELVTWEMVAYEWMRRADTPEFKRVLPHIKAGIR